MRICIIGAGVAGVQTADALSESGEYECHVFEKASDVGGVWRNNYAGYGLQVPSELYEFPGISYLPRGAFACGPTVQAYIERVVEEKSLRARCTFQFCEEVLEVHRSNDGSWSVRTNRSGSYTYTFDYCVVCTGMYHVPFIPESVTRLRLRTQPVHSSAFADASTVQAKDVVVIGGGKSAIDCAVAAAAHASRVTLLQREIHWPVPRRILSILPFKWCTYSRLGHFLLPVHWRTTLFERFCHALFGPLKYLMWRLMELIFCAHFGLFKDYANMARLEIDLFNGGQILTTELRDALVSGRIRRVVTSDVENVIDEHDVVVCGTGFRKDYGLFDGDTLQALDVQCDGLWLYKNMLPPCVPNLAFVGSEVSTFNNILTAHLQSRWLLAHLGGGAGASSRMKERMMAYVERERAWKRAWMPPSASRASLVQLHMTKYHDILMRDVQQPLVKARWWEWVLPLEAADYRSVE